MPLIKCYIKIIVIARFTVVILFYKSWSNMNIDLTTGTPPGPAVSTFGDSCCKGPDVFSRTAMSDRKALNIVTLQGLIVPVVTDK